MTDFIDKINGYSVGGDAVNGEWIRKGTYLAGNVNLSQNNTNTYTLALPDDNYDYEIIGWIAIDSAASTGARALAQIRNGADNFLQKVGTDYARRNYVVQGCGTFRMVIPANARQLKITAEGENITGMYIRWSWYRRLGWND